MGLAPPSRIRSIPSGSTNTITSIPIFRSIISPSAAAVAFARCRPVPVDFGASDGPMTDEQIAESKVKVLHVPTVLGAVVPAYNIPGVNGEVKFTPDVLAGHLPRQDHEVERSAHHEGESGHQLSRPEHHGRTSLRRQRHDLHLYRLSLQGQPRLEGAVRQGNLGEVARWPWWQGQRRRCGSIRQLPGSIGYIELIYALQNKIPFGSVQNSSKNFMKASLGSTTEAAEGVKMPADFRVSITNPPGKNAYPIASFTWLLIPDQSRRPEQGKDPEGLPRLDAAIRGRAWLKRSRMLRCRKTVVAQEKAAIHPR